RVGSTVTTLSCATLGQVVMRTEAWPGPQVVSKAPQGAATSLWNNWTNCRVFSGEMRVLRSFPSQTAPRTPMMSGLRSRSTPACSDLSEPASAPRSPDKVVSAQTIELTVVCIASGDYINFFAHHSNREPDGLHYVARLFVCVESMQAGLYVGDATLGRTVGSQRRRSWLVGQVAQ